MTTMTQTNLRKGDKVMIVLRNGQMIAGEYSHIAPNGKAYVKGENGVAYERGLTSLKKIGEAQTNFRTNSPSAEADGSSPPHQWK
jgi:hypothetical protein